MHSLYSPYKGIAPIKATEIGKFLFFVHTKQYLPVSDPDRLCDLMGFPPSVSVPPHA